MTTQTPTHNEKIYQDMEAILQRIQFGDVTFSVKLHRGAIQSMTVYGKQSVRKRENIEAVAEIANRLKKSFDNDQTAKINFDVDVRHGKVFEIVWDSTLTRRYIDA